MPIHSSDNQLKQALDAGSSSTLLRLECLTAGDCYVCARARVRSSGGKWLCRACGFVLTCCDP